MKTKVTLLLSFAPDKLRCRDGSTNHFVSKAHKMIVSLTFVFCLLSYSLFPQNPQGFNYQSVIRGATGSPLPDHNTGLKFSILQGSASGTVVYSETFDLNSDAQGVISLVIGAGTPASGNFSSIDWTNGPYFLKVQTDPDGGTNYTLTETKSLQWVPFAHYANKAEAVDDGNLQVVGDASQNDEEALFEVKRNDGQTVFAVYPDGVRIYVMDEPGKGSKSGFAVGGFNPGKGITSEYFRVSPDSIRMYIDTTSVKGKKGGFAVGGYNPAKDIKEEYLRVTPDSVRVYITDKTGKGTKGGFAVGGYNPAKGGKSQFLKVTTDSTRIFVRDSTAGFGVASIETGKAESFLDLTTQNYFIGHQSGQKVTTAIYNQFVGYQSGLSDIAGSYNSFFGYRSGYSTIGTAYPYGKNNSFYGYLSGYSNTNGSENAFMGARAGYKNTTGYLNTFIGSYTGENCLTGWDNTFLGSRAGQDFTSGNGNVYLGSFSGQYSNSCNYNTYVGALAGQRNVSGTDNTSIGHQAGMYNQTGSYNVCIGTLSGYFNDNSSNVYVGAEVANFLTGGYDNVMIGRRAGYNASGGHHNVFLGYNAGYNESGNYKLYIEPSSNDMTTALIYGDFAANTLRFNGNVGIRKAPAYDLDISGDINIDKNGIILYAMGDEAIWYNGTYYSWGYGGSYNFFGDRITIGDTYGSTSYALYVLGSAYATGIWASSDGRYKKDLEEIEAPVDKVLKMRGISYRWNTEEYSEKNFPEGRHYGVVAQEIEQVLPEIVNESESGEKAVAYNEIIPVLIEAIKEQQKMIDEQKQQIDELKSRMDERERK